MAVGRLIPNRTTKSGRAAVCLALWYISALSCVPNRGGVLRCIPVCLAPRTIICRVIQSWPRAHIMRDTRRRWRRCVLAIGIGFGRRVVTSSSSFRARSRSCGSDGGGGGIMKIKWRIKKRGRERSMSALTRTSPSAMLGDSEDRKGSREETVTGVPRPRVSVELDGNTASRRGIKGESDCPTGRTILPIAGSNLHWKYLAREPFRESKDVGLSQFRVAR